jgi:hypothetical protein
MRKSLSRYASADRRYSDDAFGHLKLALKVSAANCGADHTGHSFRQLESLYLVAVSLPKAPRPLLERADRAQEVYFAKFRPIDVREVEFAMGALP